MPESGNVSSPTMCVWNDGSGSLFTEEISEDEVVQVTDDRYLGEYRGEGWDMCGWIGPGLSEKV